MIALDTNLLVCAHREDSPFHAAALACVTGCAEGRAAWALPWPRLHEFFAIVTHLRVDNPPMPTDAALAQVDAWLESPSLVLLTEPERHWPTLRALTASAPGLPAGRGCALLERPEANQTSRLRESLHPLPHGPGASQAAARHVHPPAAASGANAYRGLTVFRPVHRLRNDTALAYWCFLTKVR